jgi:putative ABC transport system permease protein
MIRLGLRDARAHFGRFAMSIVAIALGVAFIVGAFSLSALMSDQVSSMFVTSYDHDVYVQGPKKKASGSNTPAGQATSTISGTRETLPVSLQNTIQKVAGVKSVSVIPVVRTATLVGSDGTPVQTRGSAMTFIPMSATQPWRSARFTAGRAPRNGHEIALEEQTAQKAGLKKGSTATVVYRTAARKVRVVGIFTARNKAPGAILVGIDPGTAREETLGQSDDPHRTRLISVYGTHQLDERQQKTLAHRINQALASSAPSAHAHAITGDQYRADSTQSIRDQVGFIQPVILVFAAIALFVAGFIISNTFTMIVHESMRGYALLRSIGASSLQVFETVIIEALVLGLVGSGVGILLGWGLLALMGIALSAAGMSATLVPTLSGVVVGLIIGIVITVLAASLPARQAALAPPIQAMNATLNPEKPVRARGIIGAMMSVAGVLCWGYVLALAHAQSTDSTGPTPWAWANNLSQGWLLGIGAALVVVGMIVLAPALVSPAGVVLGWIPSHIWKVSGKLAVRNISRSKRRTANTASALLIGVAVVSCIATLASSVQASVAGLLGNDVRFDLAALSPTAGTIPQKAADAVAKTSGIQSVSTNYMLIGMTYNGRQIDGLTVASQPNLFSNLMTPVTRGGNADTALHKGQLVVGQNIAKDRKWKVGQTLTVTATRHEVDQAATNAAIKDFQQKTEAKIRTLMAQGKLQEVQQAQQSAAKVNRQQFVRLSKKTVVKHVKIGAIVTNSMYRNAVIVTDSFARSVTSLQMMIPYSQLIRLKPGVSIAEGKRRLKKAVKPYYVVQIMDRNDLQSMASQMINQILLLIDMLLILSIVIAAFGVVNTLLLSISERTREIGLLRAVGTSNGQVRGMIAIEAVIQSVLGAVLGMIIGIAAGVVVRATFATNGLDVLSIPWAQLGWFLLASIAVGLIASISPSSHALKVPVLDAVASDE